MGQQEGGGELLTSTVRRVGQVRRIGVNPRWGRGFPTHTDSPSVKPKDLPVLQAGPVPVSTHTVTTSEAGSSPAGQGKGTPRGSVSRPAGQAAPGLPIRTPYTWAPDPAFQEAH